MCLHRWRLGHSGEVPRHTHRQLKINIDVYFLPHDLLTYAGSQEGAVGIFAKVNSRPLDPLLLFLNIGDILIIILIFKRFRLSDTELDPIETRLLSSRLMRPRKKNREIKSKPILRV